MENFKFMLVSIIILAVLALVGYWAIFTIEPGNVNVDRQKQQELEDKNKELEKEVEGLKSELGLLQATQEEQVKQAEDALIAESEKNPPATTPASSKYQSLINDLQKLVADNVFMKEGSRGTRVGTVQTFLNTYNKTSKKIDNDYGKGMKADVAAFQKTQGLTADGEAGPSTFRKMIEWLKKQ